MSYIEHHLHWAKTPGNDELARLNIVTAKSLIEAANLVRALCRKLNDADGGKDE